MKRDELGTFSGTIFEVTPNGDIYIYERSAGGLEDLEFIITKDDYENAKSKLGEVFTV